MSDLVVSGLTLSIGDKRLLDHVGFVAPGGALTGLIGPNGAGKSSLIGTLIGLHRADAGSMRFGDAELRELTPTQRARIVAYVEQSATTSERLTVADVVALGRLPHQSLWQQATAADEQAVAAAIAAFRLAPLASRLYQTLSGGEQQRVQMARALAQAPRLLLLDEPTSHLDIDGQLRTLTLLRGLAQGGRTVVMALHDLNLALRFSDHLVVLAAGRVVAEGAPTAVLTPALLQAVYGISARIVDLPETGGPLIVYDRAADARPDTESGLTTP